MSCQGLVWVRTLAAEFRTQWSLSRVFLGTAVRFAIKAVSKLPES